MRKIRNDFQEVARKSYLAQEPSYDLRGNDGVFASGKVALLERYKIRPDNLGGIEGPRETRDLVMRCPSIAREVRSDRDEGCYVRSCAPQPRRYAAAARVSDQHQAWWGSPCRDRLVERRVHRFDDLGGKAVGRPVTRMASRKRYWHGRPR